MLYRMTASHPVPFSILGFGCMRFPRRRGGIDENATFALLSAALDAGVNYFDTAYIYPGSEEVLGKFLEKTGRREDVNIATKLPHYLIKSRQDLDKYFNEQLQRLRTGYIDNYLMHMLPDVKTWERLKGLGVEDWLEEKKAAGKIRRVGFSYHGGSAAFCKLVDAYGWDFCQIQYNYMDENSQAGRTGLQYAAGKGLPVIIMEPLRGGRLADGLPEGAKKLLSKSGATPASFGLRWLWDQGEVTVVLSGMNTMEALQENLATASTAAPGCFTEDERQLLNGVRKEINAKIKVGCTGCGYCMPCPKGVDIPGTFRCYNESFTDGLLTAEKEYFMCAAMRPVPARASQCVQCGRCKSHCPQSIDIPAQLQKAAGKLENPVFRAVAWGARKLKFFG